MEQEDEYLPMTPADYDRLVQIFASFPSTDAMTLEELDGYFCALACSPQEVPSEEGMALLWARSATTTSSSPTSRQQPTSSA